jgi:hypothetical protein
MAFGNGPRIVTSGLILSLDAGDKNSYPGSGTIWNDLSGNNNSGSLINGPTFNSANGGSIVFDGVNDYVSGNIQNATTYTINVWAYNLSNTTIGGSVISTAISPPSPSTFIQIGGDYNPWQFNFSVSNVKATINQWVMLTAIQTATTQQLYINGVPVINTISNIATTNLGTTYNIGRRTDGVYLNTYVAILQIYNRVFSTTEILQNYNAQKSRFGL